MMGVRFQNASVNGPHHPPHHPSVAQALPANHGAGLPVSWGYRFATPAIKAAAWLGISRLRRATAAWSTQTGRCDTVGRCCDKDMAV